MRNEILTLVILVVVLVLGGNQTNNFTSIGCQNYYGSNDSGYSDLLFRWCDLE